MLFLPAVYEPVEALRGSEAAAETRRRQEAEKAGGPHVSRAQEGSQIQVSILVQESSRTPLFWDPGLINSSAPLRGVQAFEVDRRGKACPCGIWDLQASRHLELGAERPGITPHESGRCLKPMPSLTWGLQALHEGL